MKKSKLNKNIFQEVYKIVKKIPKGKVMTYGEIAKELVITPRTVGWALHANKTSEVPCHRVVDRNGRLAPNFAFGGAKEQKRRLVVEKVIFKDNTHVDLNKCMFNF